MGIGVIPPKTTLLLNLMDHFLDHLVGSKILSDIEVVSKTGGSIPCETHQKTLFNNILLLGDAAGHAHPITGAGILTAVMAGEIAGRIAAEAVAKGDLAYLAKYETEWKEMFGKPLFYGTLKRKSLEENWNQPGVDFEGLIRKTWVGFKEYHADRKKNPPPSPFF